jgi:Endonuclease/Exonuclease/phosphatase family
MQHRVFRLAFVGIVLAAACSADSVSSPPDPTAGNVQLADGRPALTVMSRNLYIGADVDAVIGTLASPDPSDDIPALLGAITTLQETDFPARVRALAEEIARERPHAVGLQEVSDLDIDLAGLGLPIVIQVDFLPALQAELAARGLNYQVAAQVTNVQAAPLPGISLVDTDVLLVDASRVTLGSFRLERNFATNIGVVAPGVDIKRGYVAVDVTVDGRSYIIASTHLESGASPGLDQLRAAQAIELVTILPGNTPTVILGDLNDVPGSLMHRVLTEAGFADVWAALQSRKAGFTCCHLSNLSNDEPVLSQRIDYILARGFVRKPGSLAGQIRLTGAKRSDRVPGPVHLLWPSDHAGIVAGLLSPRQGE